MSDSTGQHKEKVAIVGGGIAGLYCALVLQRQGYQARIFETANRLGGRIRTVRLDENYNELDKSWTKDKLNFYVEFGPMRLELDKQKLLAGLLADLGIGEDEPPQGGPYLVDFPAYASPASQRDPAFELRPEEVGKTPLELMRLAFLRIVTALEVEKGSEAASDFLKLQRELIEAVQLAGALHQSVDQVFCGWIKKLGPREHWHLQTCAKLDGVLLYRLGFWNLLCDYLSHDAMAKVRELGTFYHLLEENPNAAEWLVWWMVGLSASDRMQGIYGGMECIVDLLQGRLAEGSVELNSWVTHIEPGAGGGYRLKFRTPEGQSHPREGEVYDRVILALPRRSAQAIQKESRDAFAGEKEIEGLLESAFGFPMVKTFVVLKKRWWEEDNMANRFATRIPTRELHYWKAQRAASRQGLIMAYTDRPASSFWAAYVPSGAQVDAHREKVARKEGDPDPAKPLKEPLRGLMLRKLARYINENNVPEVKVDDIAWYGIRDWGRAPFSGANHAWRPYRRYWVVMRRLAEINAARIHICGEAYSDYHGFIEGPLRSAAYVLHRILDLPAGKPAKEGFTWLPDHGSERSRQREEVRYFEGLRTWAEYLDQVKEDDEFKE